MSAGGGPPHDFARTLQALCRALGALFGAMPRSCLVNLGAGQPTALPTLPKEARDVAAGAAVVTRTITLMSTVYTMLTKQLNTLRVRLSAATAVQPRAMAAAGRGPELYSVGSELEPLCAWLGVWEALLPTSRMYVAWLRGGGKAGWSVPNQRRVPASLYARERFTLTLLELLESERGLAVARIEPAASRLLAAIRAEWSAGADGLAGRVRGSGTRGRKHRASRNGHMERSRRAADCEGGVEGEDDSEDEGETQGEEQDEDVDEDEDEGEEAEDESVAPAEVAVLRGASRRRLRSRNPYIDSELAHGGGDDSYADLEDFIVCKRGRNYL